MDRPVPRGAKVTPKWWSRRVKLGTNCRFSVERDWPWPVCRGPSGPHWPVRLRENEATLRAIRIPNAQRAAASDNEKAPIPARAAFEILAFPAASRVDRTGMRTLAIRKATMGIRKDPVIGTVQPYEIRALHLGHFGRPQATSVRQKGQRIWANHPGIIRTPATGWRSSIGSVSQTRPILNSKAPERRRACVWSKGIAKVS
jgi:hypothetical protein